MKLLKINFWVLISFLLNTGIAFAQTREESNKDYDDFKRSISMSINYPSAFYSNCTPVVCLLKIEVDSAKNVKDMQLSDSADSLFLIEFNRRKLRFNTASLSKYLQMMQPSNNCKTFIIPLSYTLISCPNSFNADKMKAYFKFTGEYFKDEMVVLQPIGFLTGVQR